MTGRPGRHGVPAGPVGSAGSSSAGSSGTRPGPGSSSPRPWPADVVEHLAMAYHQLYRDNAGPDDHVARLDWDELPEHLRESNRSTARALRRELAALGYEVRPAAGDGTGLAALPAEHVQRLAQAEHARWVSDKRARGYVYGPTRRDDGTPPTDPDMVAWVRLTPDARDKDSIRFSAAPRLLAALGYEILPHGD